MILRYRDRQFYNAYFTKDEIKGLRKIQLRRLFDMVSDQIRPGQRYQMRLEEENDIVDNEITYCKTLTLEIKEVKSCLDSL